MMVLVVLSEAQAMLGIADDLEGRLPLLLETASGLACGVEVGRA